MERPRAHLPKSLFLLALVALVGALAACGETDPEAALREASQRLEERRAVVERARAELEARAAAVEEIQTEFDKRLQEARAAHDRARQALRDAEQRLAAARASVDEQASDDVLFRTVQRTLLEDRDLEGVAIAAQVRGRVVTLTGDVEDAAQRDRAVELARETAGVEGVQSRIVVKAESPPAARPAKAKSQAEPEAKGAE